MKKKQFSSIVKASRKDNKGQEIWTEIWESALPLGNLTCFLTVQLPEKMGPGLCLSWALLIASSYWQETGERYVAAICMMQPSDEWNFKLLSEPEQCPWSWGDDREDQVSMMTLSTGCSRVRIDPHSHCHMENENCTPSPWSHYSHRERGGSSHLPTWDGHVRILKPHFLLGIGWKK